MKFKPIAEINPVSSRHDGPIRLAVLGATGSIGSQTLEIMERHPDRFVLTAFSVNRNIDRALEICRRFKPKFAVVCDEESGRRFARQIKTEGGIDTEVLVGPDAMCDVVVRDDVDMVVTATVGYSGLLPTFAAISHNKDIALANKETLVVGGDYIRSLLEGSSTRIFPVDSEHSAIAQCLRGEDLDTVSRLIITASGGPFRSLPVEKLGEVTAADALKHPNWNMGAKITVDSATMMNKAFEIIEAHYLYGFPSDKIRAVVHPQSIVHSMVEFCDGALKAQLGIPDMRLPIAYALGLNHRIASAVRPLRLEEMATLTFEAPDAVKFPCLRFARMALERRGNTACIINAANEVAVAAFLEGTIRYTDIAPIIEKTVEKIDFIAAPGPDDFVKTNAESRRFAALCARQKS